MVGVCRFQRRSGGCLRLEPALKLSRVALILQTYPQGACERAAFECIFGEGSDSRAERWVQERQMTTEFRRRVVPEKESCIMIGIRTIGREAWFARLA